MKPLAALAALAAIAAIAFTASVHAAPIYRCGPDGKTYSQVPCAEGKIVEATDPRSAAQRKEARRIAELEHQRAAELERERLAAERAAKPSAAVGLSGQPAPAASGAGDGAKHDAKKGKGAKSDAAERDFVATVPGEKRKSR